MKVLLEIKDSKAGFFMELLKNFSFVKSVKLTPYKEEVLKGVAEAVEEMKQIKEGKLKATPARKLVE